MAKQINIFIENRPGRLSSITEILAQNNINIRSFIIQDRGDFGLMKMIVDKPTDAHLILADRGLACAVKDVIAVAIDDKPGNLHKLTKKLSENGFNVVDAHGFVLEPNKKGICCVEIKETAQLEKINKMLQAEGFEILQDHQLYEM
jgi:hypothetical protein